MAVFGISVLVMGTGMFLRSTEYSGVYHGIYTLGPESGPDPDRP